ncbi:MAG: phage terminase large subunit family protein [Methermicoccaceae archaeon]
MSRKSASRSGSQSSRRVSPAESQSRGGGLHRSGNSGASSRTEGLHRSGNSGASSRTGGLRASVSRQLLRLISPVHLALMADITPYPYQRAILEDSSRRLVVKAGRQVGKSTAVALKALHTSLFPSKTVLIVSPSQRQSTEILRKVRGFASHAGIPTERDTATELELPNRSRIVSLPASEHTIRGYCAHMLIVDEAAFVPDELLDAIRPMLAATNGTLVLLSTPFGKGSYFERAWHDPSFSHHDIPATQCPHISESFLASEKEHMPSNTYQQEYLAQFVDAQASVFPHSLVLGAVAEPSPAEGRLFCGVDLAKHVDWTVFCVLKAVGGVLYVVHVEAHQKEPYPLVAQRLKALHEEWGFSKVVVDASGVGDAVVDMLRWDALLPLEPFVFTQQSKSNLVESLKVALEKGTLKLSQNRNLLSELTAFQYEVASTSIRYGTQSEHDDHVIALALAVWAARVPSAPPLEKLLFGMRRKRCV